MKKLLTNKDFPAFRCLRRIVAMLVVCLAVVPAYSQSGKISLNAESEPLATVLKQIESQSGYKFTYEPADVNNKRITLRAANVGLRDVLATIAKAAGLSYTISDADRAVTLKRTGPAVRSTGIVVQGVIRDKTGRPLPGATVYVKGSVKGAIADADGKYRLEVPSANSILVFSYLGFVTQNVTVGSRTVIDMVLNENLQEVDEVVVIGYGAVKKNDLTGSVANVKMADIENVPVISVDQALQGRIAGADIMSTTGEPGATTSIRIRGTRSISASNEPLIVVDGMIDAVHDLNDISPGDIESINVLKDASSTAIYGARGSNGVIIVTTKKGEAGRLSLQFRTDLGFSQLPKKLELMNATEFALYRNDLAYFSTDDEYGEIVDGTPISKYPFPDPYSLGKGTDWLGELTRTAPYQNYSLSVNGGTKKTTYFGSVSFNDTRGIIKNSGMRRYTARFNIDNQFTDWLKVGMRLTFTHRDNNNNLANLGGTSWWQGGIYLSPLIKANSDFNDLWGSGPKFNSPLATVYLNTDDITRQTFNAAIYGEAELVKGLKLRSQASYYSYVHHSYKFQPSTLPAKVEGQGAYAYRGEYNETSILSENTLTYNKDFDKRHHFDAMVGFTAQTWESNNMTTGGNGYLLDPLLWNNMGAIPDKENLSVGTSNTRKVRMSGLFRVNYNYRQKYYLTFTARADGSSNFASDHKWGFFPSGAFKWNVHNEPFIKSVSWISEMALRLSAGRTGNDAISAYRSLPSMGSSTTGYLFGGSQPVAFYPSRIGSPKLTWETTDMYNAALDFAVLDNRIKFTVEAYMSKTKDLLLTVQRPTQSGYSNRFMNVGKTSNKGIEIAIESYNISKPKFTWSTSFTLSHNSQMVDNIGSEDFVVTYESYNPKYMMYGYVSDYPLNALWGFRYAGTWKNNAEIERNKTTKGYVSAGNNFYSPGAPRYLDINHDGILNKQDLVYLGQADPDIYGGLQNTFKIHGFTIGVYFNYSIGGKIYNISEQWMGNNSPSTNQYRYMLKAWHPLRNPDSDIPRAYSGDGLASDRLVHDATFLRLKNVSVSYTFDLRKATGNVLKSLTLSASGDNLCLWKKYNGFDPEVSSESSNSALRRLDVGAYPKSRTIIFSLQLRY